MISKHPLVQEFPEFAEKIKDLYIFNLNIFPHQGHPKYRNYFNAIALILKCAFYTFLKEQQIAYSYFLDKLMPRKVKIY